MNSELNFENNKPTATFENQENNLSFDAPKTEVKGTSNYEELNNLPTLNGVEIKGDLTSEDLDIIGSSMTEIELSTDLSNPTELMDYINVSGTYVAKNLGVLGAGGEPYSILNKGQFFKVWNLKDLYKIAGEELPDEENIIRIDVINVEGHNSTIYSVGGDFLVGEEINSLNINDYIKIDPNNVLTKNNVSSGHGIGLKDNILQPMFASENDIDNQTFGRVIGSDKIKYSVEKYLLGKAVELWKNPSPNEPFNEKEIHFNFGVFGNFDKEEIYCKDSITGEIIVVGITYMFKGACITYDGYTRIIEGKSSTSKKIKDCVDKDGNVANDKLIPLYILGYKTNILK
jgi:hypothetical protein